jgi:carbamoyltransferase
MEGRHPGGGQRRWHGTSADVGPADEPLVHAMITAFRERTDLPAVVNRSLNTAGRPIFDSPRNALECFGSAPIDVLAIESFLIRRARRFAGTDGQRAA